jgi:bifunctional ADP-heptose synthase (sugar kinase/adenylyltransferase)
LPLEERLAVLSSFSQIDWILSFQEPTPCEIIQQLRPDVLVKGSEYSAQRVPGDDLVEDVRFAPPGGPFPSHVTNLVEAIRGA